MQVFVRALDMQPHDVRQGSDAARLYDSGYHVVVASTSAFFFSRTALKAEASSTDGLLILTFAGCQGAKTRELETDY